MIRIRFKNVEYNEGTNRGESRNKLYASLSALNITKVHIFAQTTITVDFNSFFLKIGLELVSKYCIHLRHFSFT